MEQFNINKITSPRGLKKDQYDVVIIGAGIGGLVCGCYLAKAGLKVLIVEKNNKVGGYCTSFEREGFRFDCGVHTLVGCRPDGILGRIIRELELDDRIGLKRVDPSDIIICGDFRWEIQQDITYSIEMLQRRYPQEAHSIEKFFNFIRSANFVSLYSELKDKNFKYLLDLYFKEADLKSVLSVLLKNLGLPSYKVSALAGVFLYKEHIFDGGYYPEGGMQRFSDSFKEKFEKLGGELILSRKVESIVVNKNTVEGVVVENVGFIKSKYIISACDVRETFVELIGAENLPRDFLNKLHNMEPSTSAFLVFLGVDVDLKKLMEPCTGLWYFPNRNPDFYVNIGEELREENIFCMMPSLHTQNLAPKGASTIILMTTLPFYENYEYWESKRFSIENRMIEISQSILPDFSSHIIVKDSATPYTFYKYTLNSKGAIRGWGCIPEQLNSRFINYFTRFDNLFIVGHWLTSPVSQGGISMAADSGRKGAVMVIRRIKKYEF